MAGEAAASTSGRPRPQLKGHHLAWMKKHLYIACGLAIAGTILAKYTINEPRKRAYAKFYENYDPDAAFEEMRQKGIFKFSHGEPDPNFGLVASKRTN